MILTGSALRFTQNFLKDPQLVDRLLSLTDIRPTDTVLEIGPGKGIITAALAEKVGLKGRVVAVELDEGLYGSLQTTFRATPQVELFHDDILTFPLQNLGGPYTIFSNVPFAITAPLLEKLFQPTHGPEKAWLILQTDTLQDFSKGKARPTFKSLLLEPLYEIDNLYDFSRADFTPPPQADTSLFSLVRRKDLLLPPQKYQLYRDFLAHISHDRVGEGVWKKLLTKKQLEQVARHTKLSLNKGLKAQNTVSLIATFATLESSAPQFTDRVQGAFQKLRSEQALHEHTNELGGHHRSNNKKRVNA